MNTKHHVGRWAARLTPDHDNPREVAFAEEWERENSGAKVLGQLLYSHGHGAASVCNRHCNTDGLPTTLTARDRVVAATVVQWLGSNVGFSFLEEALRRCGYRLEKAKREPEREPDYRFEGICKATTTQLPFEKDDADYVPLEKAKENADV